MKIYKVIITKNPKKSADFFGFFQYNIIIYYQKNVAKKRLNIYNAA